MGQLIAYPLIKTDSLHGIRQFSVRKVLEQGVSNSFVHRKGLNQGNSKLIGTAEEPENWAEFECDSLFEVVKVFREVKCEEARK